MLLIKNSLFTVCQRCLQSIDVFFVSGHSWFHGPWFISPADTQHLPTRMFYEKEVFLSSLEETVSVGNISGKCCVLPFREYARCELNFFFFYCVSNAEVKLLLGFRGRKIFWQLVG